MELHGRKRRLKTKLSLYNTVYLYTVCVYMLLSRLTLTALSIIIHSTRAFVSITNLTMTNAASPWWRASPHYWMSFGLPGQTNRHTHRQAAALVLLFGSTHCSSRSRWKKLFSTAGQILHFICGLWRSNVALMNWLETGRNDVQACAEGNRQSWSSSCLSAKREGKQMVYVGVSVHINAMERVHSRENSHSNPFKLIRRHFA